MNVANDSCGWLVLLHQLPARPPYFRVRIWRRLQAIGAVPLKNAAHVLPRNGASEAILQELLADIVAAGGEAILLDARLLAGQGDDDVRALFDSARDADYADIALAARRLVDAEVDAGPPGANDVARLRKRLADVVALDFFGSHGRQDAEAALGTLERLRHQHPDVSRSIPSKAGDPADLRRKIWVTRSGVHVDRIACAWLIRRFIDPHARFRFVAGRSYTPATDEVRFDMADAEFTHEADRCSFETLIWRAGLEGDAGLVAIGQMIHDLDIGDARFERAETSGLGAMLAGICASTDDDLRRIDLASGPLDQFYAYFGIAGTDR